MNQPKHNRCDYCGRNAHKVAVRMPSGVVRGYCPSCWSDYAPAASVEGARVLYDRRARKTNEEQRPAVERVARFYDLESVVGQPDRSVVATAKDAAGNTRRWRIAPDGTPYPMHS